MKRATYKYGFFTILLFSIAGLLFFLNKASDPEYLVERTLRYSFTVSNPTNNAISQSTLWTYIPVKQTSTQKFISIAASNKHKLVADEAGNQKVFFELHDIAPYGSKIITIQVRVNTNEYPNAIDVDDVEIFLRAEKNIESDAPEILRTALSLEHDDEVETARSIYSWVLGHIEYKGFVFDDKGALYALQNGKGDCTEYAYLYTALARAVKLPSRSMAGFVYDKNARLLAGDYHNWSEVLLDDKWQIADAQKEVFMNSYSNYIAMHILSSEYRDELSENSQKFFHVQLPLIATMN